MKAPIDEGTVSVWRPPTGTRANLLDRISPFVCIAGDYPDISQKDWPLKSLYCGHKVVLVAVGFNDAFVENIVD